MHLIPMVARGNGKANGRGFAFWYSLKLKNSITNYLGKRDATNFSLSAKEIIRNLERITMKLIVTI